MSDDIERIKLPWEHENTQDPVQPEVAEFTNTEEAPLQAADTAGTVEIDPSGSSRLAGAEVGFSHAQPEVAETVAARQASPTGVEVEVSLSEPRAEEGEAVSISWSSGAVARSERGKAGTGGSRSLLTWAKFIALLRGENRGEEGDEVWLAEVEQPREIGGWLEELNAENGISDQPEIYRGPTSASVSFESDDGNVDFDSSVEILSGPRAEVAVPKISRGRIAVIGSAVLVFAIVLGLYGAVIPSIRGRHYKSELRLAFANTDELRASISDILAAGAIPDDIGTTGAKYRELANSYSFYAKVVAAPPPAKPLVSLSSSMTGALEAREAMLALNDTLAPAVDQVRLRGNYLDTLAAVADQMRIAEAVLSPDGEGDADALLITEATVANATSLYAVLSTQHPPTGYEALHSRLLSQVGDYVKTGREYSLALKKNDESLALSLRESLYKGARSFDVVIAEPVGQGLETATLEAIKLRSEEAARRLQ